MQAKIRLYATSLATILVLSLPCAASAQKPTLDRVDSLVAAGQAEQARASLDAWKKENQADARSTFLAARLASRAEDAEDAYLNVTLSYSGTPYAAESLLRLGQARMAAGDYKQAAIYLQRLISDYPRSEHRTPAQALLTHAKSLAPAPEQAQTPAPAPAPAPKTPAPSPAPAPAPARYSVQVAAFRELAGARTTARQLEKAGFANVRIVTVPSNALIRVRVGAFESLTDAAAHGAKIKAAGFTVAIVSDATTEQAVRN